MTLHVCIPLHWRWGFWILYLTNCPNVEALSTGWSTTCGFGFLFPAPLLWKHALSALSPSSFPVLKPVLSNSQHSPEHHRWACSDLRSRIDFQVSSNHYLCSKLSSCICINFLFPKVSSMYFKAAQLLFHIFQGTGVFNVMWGQHYTMGLWQGHTEMNTVCEQTLNGSLNYRVRLCCF